jgi:hypothetical protein
VKIKDFKDLKVVALDGYPRWIQQRKTGVVLS